jgi:hypothetical protein
MLGERYSREEGRTSLEISYLISIALEVLRRIGN